MICRNKTLKKKRMLDLITKRKMSPKKKQIIKTYGKDMIAEMYLDLINLAEIKNKTGLMNLIKDDNFSDQIAIKLVYVAIGLQKMPKFDTDLGTLVDKYKIKESVN